MGGRDDPSVTRGKEGWCFSFYVQVVNPHSQFRPQFPTPLSPTPGPHSFHFQPQPHFPTARASLTADAALLALREDRPEIWMMA